jgi:hypothetical protein
VSAYVTSQVADGTTAIVLAAAGVPLVSDDLNDTEVAALSLPADSSAVNWRALDTPQSPVSRQSVKGRLSSSTAADDEPQPQLVAVQQQQKETVENVPFSDKTPAIDEAIAPGCAAVVEADDIPPGCAAVVEADESESAAALFRIREIVADVENRWSGHASEGRSAESDIKSLVLAEDQVKGEGTGVLKLFELNAMRLDLMC